MMVPLNLEHPNGFSSSASLFGVSHSKWIFCIGQIRLDFDGLGIDDFSRNFNTLFELGYMEDIMDGR
jgi:hypothetical protein